MGDKLLEQQNTIKCSKIRIKC